MTHTYRQGLWWGMIGLKGDYTVRFSAHTATIRA